MRKGYPAMHRPPFLHRFLTILLISVIFAGLPGNLQCQSQDPGFLNSTDWEEGFERRDVKLNGAEVIVALTPKSQLYPTFNVIMMPTEGPIDGTDWAKEIREDYLRTGILDCEISAVSTDWQHTVDLKFRDANGIELISRVTILPAEDRHYIITFLAPAVEMRANTEVWVRLTAGAIKFFNLPPLLPFATEDEGSPSNKVLLGILGLVALGLGSFWAFKTKRTTH